MSRAPTGGPAYPTTLEQYQQQERGHGPMTGMSVRDRFAIAVVAGWNEAYHRHAPTAPAEVETYAQGIARFAYEVADAMMTERERER